MIKGAQTNARVVQHCVILQAEKTVKMQEKIDELEAKIAQLDDALFQKEKKLDTVEAARAMLQMENAELRKDKERLQRCLAFFASVIKSGEQWSDSTQEAIDAAMEAAK